MVIACEFRRPRVLSITIRVTRPRGPSVSFDSYSNVGTIGGSHALHEHVAYLNGVAEDRMLLDHLTDPASYNTEPPSFAMATSNGPIAGANTGEAMSGIQTSTPAPTPAPLPDQYFANSHYAGATMDGQTSAGGMSMNTGAFGTNGSIPPTPGSLAGRKRSRGDIHEDDEELAMADGSISTPGPAMIAMQSNGWAEEQANRPPFNLSHNKRPSFSSRKSQRKDASSANTIPDVSTMPTEDIAQLVLPPQMREATAEPLIDEATRVLGISWTRMDSTEALQINKAAYSKWIANHYTALENVEVWFENSALPGYLAEARNIYSGQAGFYIFSEDLTEARLVTTDPKELMGRLKLLPALHLAAPGGHLKAEDDASLAASTAPPEGICAAHAMEMD